MRRRTEEAIEIARRVHREQLRPAERDALIEATMELRNPRLSRSSRQTERSEIGGAIAHERVAPHIDRIVRYVRRHSQPNRFHHSLLSACRFVRDHGIRRLGEWSREST